MAYANRQELGFGTVTNVTGTTVLYAPSERVAVHKVGVRLTAAGNADGTVTFQKLTGTNTVATIGTVVVATASVGKLIYKELSSPVDLEPGDALQITQVTGSSATILLPSVAISIREMAVAEADGAVASS